MLELKNVSKIYPGRVAALLDVSFSLEAGEFLTILGPTGAGKTTLTKLISAEEFPTQGEIIFSGISSEKLRGKKLLEWRKKIGTVYQDLRLLKERTLGENVSLPLRVLGKSRDEIKSHAQEILGFVGLAEREKSYPEELSYGERQKGALARAIVSQPELILADEPTGNLDSAAGQEILNLLKGLNHLGRGVIVTTNQKEIADYLSGGKVLELSRGRLK